MNNRNLFLLNVAIIFMTGCANVDTIEPENATIRFAFAPSAESKTTFVANGLTWTITRAAMLPGEIGIHWNRENSSRAVSEINPIAPRHDVSGKISPKIYGYFAVNLLDTTFIQQLTVDPKHYDHIHMVALPKNAITTNDTVKGISQFPELQTNSVCISGTVSNGTSTLPFKLENNTVYGENDLGDILFSLPIYKNEIYEIYVHPNFEKWFAPVVVESSQFEGQDTIRINATSNVASLTYFKQAFKADNAMNKTFRKVQ